MVGVATSNRDNAGCLMRILVVEDEGHVAELLQSALERLGNSCILARSADHADRVLEQHSVDAITLDLRMPGRDGLEWLESVSATRPELARQTLVITGQDVGPQTAARLARCGAGMLGKPFTLESLGEAMRTQIVRSGARSRGNRL